MPRMAFDGGEMATSPADGNAELEKLKLLYDYTKFHVGIYITSDGILAALIAASDKDFPLQFNRTWLIAAVIFIAIAGFAGGVLLSSMCHENSLAVFWGKELGPFRARWWRAEKWSYLEHTAFWVAIGCALFAFLCPK